MCDFMVFNFFQANDFDITPVCLPKLIPHLCSLYPVPRKVNPHPDLLYLHTAPRSLFSYICTHALPPEKKKSSSTCLNTKYTSYIVFSDAHTWNLLPVTC